MAGEHNAVVDQVVEGAPDTGGDSSDPDVAAQALNKWSEIPDDAGEEVASDRAETAPDDTGDEEDTEVEEEQPRRQPQGGKKPVKPAPKKLYKVVVNGKEELVDLTEPELQKLNAVSAMRASQASFREAAKLRKEAEETRAAIAAAREEALRNPMAIFKALGLDENAITGFARNHVYERIAEQIDPNTGQPYTPEQARILELQRTLKQKEQAELSAKQQQEAAEYEKVKETVRRDLDRTFTEALQESGLPPTQYAMMRLADLMEAVGPDVDPKQLAPLVLEDLSNESARTIASMPIEAAAKILGKKFMDSLRKYDFEKAKGSQGGHRSNPQRFGDNKGQRIQSRSKRITDPNEAQDALEKWAQGR